MRTLHKIRASRVSAVLLCLAMIITLTPMTVFAAPGGADDPVIIDVGSVVSGGEGYTYINNVITLNQPWHYQIEGTTAINRVSVGAGATGATVRLKSVSIDLAGTDAGSPLAIANGSSAIRNNITVILENTTLRTAGADASAFSLDGQYADATLTLVGNNTLATTGGNRAGIHVPSNSGVNAALTINGGGSLSASGSGNGAGVGGSNGAGGTITIESGTIYADGGNSGGAGIGSGSGNSGETIIIRGGDVTATGHGGGAGIGGSYGGSNSSGGGGIVAISGGTVTAEGSNSGDAVGAGIGGGGRSSNSNNVGGGTTVVISGGRVTATPGTPGNGTAAAGYGIGPGRGADDSRYGNPSPAIIYGAGTRVSSKNNGELRVYASPVLIALPYETNRNVWATADVKNSSPTPAGKKIIPFTASPATADGALTMDIFSDAASGGRINTAPFNAIPLNTALPVTLLTGLNETGKEIVFITSYTNQGIQFALGGYGNSPAARVTATNLMSTTAAGRVDRIDFSNGPGPGEEDPDETTQPTTTTTTQTTTSTTQPTTPTTQPTEPTQPTTSGPDASEQAVQAVIDMINALPGVIGNRADADRVAAATNAYNALTPAQKDKIPTTVIQRLENAQNQAKAANHSDSGVEVGGGLVWNARVTATRISEHDPRYAVFALRIGDGMTMAALFDISLTDSLTGGKYIIPPGSTVNVRLEDVDLTDMDTIAVFHEKSDGTMETLAATASGRSVLFATSSFSYFAVAGKSAELDANEPPLNSKAKRISGADRYDTAIEVSRTGWTKADNVVLASGLSFPDALTGGPLACMLDAPILLTQGSGSSVETTVLNRMNELGAKNVYVLGGYAAISFGIEQQLRGAGFFVERLAGNDRYETSVAIAKKMDFLRKKAPSAIFVVDSVGFADALSITPVAALTQSPIILTPNNRPGFTAASMNYAAACGTKTAYIAGGTSAVKPDVETKLKAMGFTFERVYGANRYETSAQIYNKFKGMFSGGKAIMATGVSFPDALSGGALGGKMKAPLFLVNGASTDTYSAPIKSAVTTLKPTTIYLLGGTSAVRNLAANIHIA
ncbi:MAG: cell wall-binding repeat-containing protein [Oscillospiraceae bacterium]|nr:cell wall-binding repeat-containing protein [Oscillospiraceae bacterium]